MDFLRRFRAIAIAACALVVLAGCARLALTESDIVGTWASSGPDGLVATWQFNGDGTFMFEDVPLNTLPAYFMYGLPMTHEADWTRLASSTGTWRLDGSLNEISVTIDRSDSYHGLIGTEVGFDAGKLYTLMDPASDSIFKFEYSKLE